MSQYLKFNIDHGAPLPGEPPAILAIPAIPEEQSSKNSNNSNATPLTPHYPCIVCASTNRWDDHGIWRCLACWPSPERQG